MKKLLFLLILIGFLVFPKVAYAETANITYSPDYKTITIVYKGKTYIIPRPIVPNPTFTATHKTYWVATTGSDTNMGTETSPFKTISHAINLSVDGDVIYVKAGSYVDSPHFYYENGNVVLSAAPGDIGKVYLEAPQSYWGQDHSIITVQGDGSFPRATKITINGFIIHGYRDTQGPISDEGASGIHFQNGGSGYVFNTVSYGNQHCGLKEQGHGGVFTAIGNVFFDNGVLGTPRDHGIYSPTNDAVMSGNISFNNTGWGIHSFDSEGHGMTNQTIDHNVLFGNGYSGILMNGFNSNINHNTAAYNTWVGMHYWHAVATNNTVTNNIFAFNSPNALAQCDDSAWTICPHDNNDDHNVYYPRASGDPDPHIPPGTHEVYVDPQFINPDVGDFRLKAGSPATGYGAYDEVTSHIGISDFRTLLSSFSSLFEFNHFITLFGKIGAWTTK